MPSLAEIAKVPGLGVWVGVKAGVGDTVTVSVKVGVGGTVLVGGGDGVAAGGIALVGVVVGVLDGSAAAVTFARAGLAAVLVGAGAQEAMIALRMMSRRILALISLSSFSWSRNFMAFSLTWLSITTLQAERPPFSSSVGSINGFRTKKDRTYKRRSSVPESEP